MDGDGQDGRLGRRLLVLRVAGLGTAAGALSGCVVQQPVPVYAPARVGTGITDADPGDGPGFGRGGYRGPARTGLTDADPGDGPGFGRGGYRPRAQGRPYTGINDGDPGDPSGYGTGWRQRNQGRGVTDNDPGDAPGRGRGWR